MSLNNPNKEALEQSSRLRDESVPRVTLTRAPVVAPKWCLSSGVLTPPISLAYLAASLREEGYPVSIIDPVGEDPFEVNTITGGQLMSYGWSLDKIVSAIPEDTRYIGLSCMFSHEWPMSKLLAQKIRERFPNTVIIAGGEHMTAVPEFSLRDCTTINYAVLGEGEETMVELINTLEQGNDVSFVAGLAYMKDTDVIRTILRKRIHDLDSMAWPAWDLVPVENYLRNGLSFGISQGRTLPIVATRGCPYCCTFCSSPKMWTQHWYDRSPKNVADEIETYVNCYGTDNFDFYDPTPIFHKKWIIKFCLELIKRNLNISWQIPAGTRSEIIDDEVASLLSRAGHRNLVYAPESGSERILKLIKKKANLPSMLESMRAAIRNRFSIKLNVVFGFPQETTADIFRSYKFLAKVAWIGVDDVTISTFIPYPGSELFNDLVRAEKIKSLDKEYFYALTMMGDVRSIYSFSEKIGRRALLAYRLFGMFLFYSLSYLFRPQRFLQTLRHLYRGNYQTRIEKALSSFVNKTRLYNRT